MTSHSSPNENNTTVEFRVLTNEPTAKELINTFNQETTNQSSAAFVNLHPNDLDQFEGTLNAALELLFLAPAFDHVDGDELEYHLGRNIYAVISKYGSKPIVATNPSFNADKPISKNNCPVSPDHKIPLKGEIATYTGWKPAGPQFKVHPESNDSLVSISPARNAFEINSELDPEA